MLNILECFDVWLHGLGICWHGKTEEVKSIVIESGPDSGRGPGSIFPG